MGYCAGKLGDVELFNVFNYLITGNPGKRNRWRLQNNAGFFTYVKGKQEYQHFCGIYLKAVELMDLLGVWFNLGEDYVIEQCIGIAKISKVRFLEPYFYESP